MERDIEKITLKHKDGKETEYNLDKEKYQVIIQVRTEEDEVIQFTGESEGFTVEKSEEDKQTLKVKCSFCGKGFVLEYYHSSNAEELCPTCGVYTCLSNTDEPNEVIEIFDFLTDEDVKTLTDEKLIRFQEVEWGEMAGTKVPLVWLLQIFPFTDKMLDEAITEKQKTALKKRLHNPLTANDLNRIQDLKKKLAKVINMIDNDEFYYTLYSIVKKKLPEEEPTEEEE